MNAPPASLLIVEDDPEIRRLLADFLQQEGFEVECADSGKAMDAVLQRLRPDLLVLDLMLPGEDGLSICRRLRADDNIPIASSVWKWAPTIIWPSRSRRVNCWREFAPSFVAQGPRRPSSRCAATRSTNS
jgi:CheY-like chemotaxis protein